MKAHWIKKSGAPTLIVFFGGFACGKGLLARAKIPADCDLVMLCDYRDFDCSADFGGYARTAVVAWSFGVRVAEIFAEKIGVKNPFAKVALCGSRRPIDDYFGIPHTVFQKTLDGFGEENREKFFRRVCGGAAEFSEFSDCFSAECAGELKRELAVLGKCFAENLTLPPSHWDAAFAARRDRIFSEAALLCEWGASLKMRDGAHLNAALFDEAFSFVSRRAARVGAQFERSAALYSDSATVQLSAAKKLSSMLAKVLPENFEPKTVLEIGCGTGFLTRELAGKFPRARWILNDLSLRMCEISRGFAPAENRVVAGDILSVPADFCADLIVSSSCFQWISDLRILFSKLASVSSVGTVLAFSTFGGENFRQIREISGAGLAYPSKEEIAETLESTGFEVASFSAEVRDVGFAAPSDVLRHIKATGVNGRFASFWTPAKLRSFSKSYSEKFSRDGNVLLTYNPVYFVAKKKGVFL